MTDQENARWAVQLEGAHLDIQAWEMALPDLSNYRVEKVPQASKMVFALCGPPLQQFTEARDVCAKALSFIEQMNGLMWLAYRAEPLCFGGTVFQLGANGSVGVTVMVGFGPAIRLGGLRPVITVTQADGTVVASTPATDPVLRHALLAAEQSADVMDLLVQMGRADNWYDLYKAIELAERLVGGEPALRNLMGHQSGAFKAVRTTANFFRHARTHRPGTLSTMEDARALLAQAVEIVLRRTSPRPS
jgi:hypothetical protein